ncbi:MAG: DoxX family membrane protein [Candidatus Kapaibacterium sp.]|nr:MAG: DoxX family membrane protein [Candidatus Kapabacteria bacterium]
MSSVFFHPVVILAARLVLGSVFIIAGVEKIANPDAFAKAIHNYQLLPYSMLNIMALTLPWLEVLAGALLIFGVRLRASSALTALMLIVFIAAIASAMMRGLSIDCGCFSQGSAASEPVGWKKIAEDVALLVLSVQIFAASWENEILPFSFEAMRTPAMVQEAQ